MAESWKCLFHKCEDQSSIPRPEVKMPDVVAHMNPASGKQRQDDFWRMASQSSLTGELSAKERHVSNEMLGVPEHDN